VDIHFMDLVGAVLGQLLKLSMEINTGEFGLNLEVYVDMSIYLLTAVGLTPVGSRTVHIYAKNNTINLGRLWAVPVFASYTQIFALQLRKTTGKPQSG
jgi:hypothetical protein